MRGIRFPNLSVIERLPWGARALLGTCAGLASAMLTYWVHPLRAFPLLFAFPTVILSAWFFGMWGCVSCALIEAVLVDSFLTRSQVRFSVGNATEQLRLTVFLSITILLGWAIRRLAEQRADLGNRELQQSLSLANAERQLAEQRAQATQELRERDEMLKIALKANGMGLWVWDLEQDAMHRSDEMFRMVGRDRTELERDPRAWLQVVHPDDVDGVVEALHKTRDQGTDYHRQYRILWPDGSVRWIESQGKSQRNSDGQITKVVGVMADVTHRKLAEEAMLRAEKLAVAGRLAASVAHEINNPLEAVANLLYLITLADAVEDAQEQAGKALEQLMRVSQITQQTLKFHRQTGLPRSVNLSEVVDGVLSFFRSKLAQAGVAVKLRAEAETAVPCMPSEAQQIFANLVTNAIDAMPHGGRLTIRLRPSLDWRDRATRGMRITFADSGVGMSRDTLRRIFEPFFTTKLDIGTGLGMWVVAQLVERHNGQVRVWSTQREGRSGTAFSIFLPLDSKPPREVISGAADAAGSEGMQDRALIRG